MWLWYVVGAIIWYMIGLLGSALGLGAIDKKLHYRSSWDTLYGYLMAICGLGNLVIVVVFVLFWWKDRSICWYWLRIKRDK